jgi:molybdopterin-guanine dinucleotide biosynthesis protein A
MADFPIQLSVTGYILVGGHSQRFGGDKALALYKGKPLVAWAVGSLQDLGLAPVLVGPDPSPYQGWCQAAVTSEQPGLGPTAGVQACLEACSTTWALILSVDMPGVSAQVLQALLAAGCRQNESKQVICYARSASRRQPFPGLYSPSLLQIMAGLSAGGPMQRLLDVARLYLLGPDLLPAGRSWSQAFHNVNAPSDLSR